MKPSIGRDVHFVDDEGKHRPAKVLEVYEEEGRGYVLDLLVFKRPSPLSALRGLDDVYPSRVTQDESHTKHPWTWHWPERVD